MRVTPDRRYGWRLVQIAELLRRSQRAHARALDTLDQLDVAALPHASIVVSDPAALEALGEAIGDLAAQIHLLTGNLPDASVTIASGDVVVAAASDLAGGIYDEARVLLAARVLPIATGWPALASALRGTDAHHGWEATTLGWLLGSFRDARLADVERVLMAARLSPGACVATCSSGQLLRLADALERRWPA